MNDANSEAASNYIRDKFMRHNSVSYENHFSHERKLFSNKSNQKGMNLYSIIKGRRNIANECFIVTFNRRNVLEIIVALSFLETMSLSDRPIP